MNDARIVTVPAEMVAGVAMNRRSPRPGWGPSWLSNIRNGVPTASRAVHQLRRQFDHVDRFIQSVRFRVDDDPVGALHLVRVTLTQTEGVQAKPNSSRIRTGQLGICVLAFLG